MRRDVEFNVWLFKVCSGFGAVAVIGEAEGPEHEGAVEENAFEMKFIEVLITEKVQDLS